jgi:hypothetical protein
MKRLGGVLFGACLAAGLFASGQARADAITAVLPSGEAVQFKYNNLETVVDSVGDVLTGIFAISSINDPSGTPVYFASGLSGSELNGFFTGLTVAEITPTASGFNIYFTGGTLNMYNVPVGSYSPTSPLSPLDPQICKTAPGSVCPTPWLTMDFVPGVVATDDLLTPFDETLTTLFSTVTALSSPLTGTGDGNLLITGGTAASSFNPNMSLQSNLQSCPTADPNFAPNCAKAGAWPLASFDPVVGSTVPEPGTLLLMGAALAGLAASRRARGKA